jgi:GTPase SAR1 family protein
MSNDFDPSIHRMIAPTNSTVTIDIDGHEVKLTLWDTAGQEQL